MPSTSATRWTTCGQCRRSTRRHAPVTFLSAQVLTGPAGKASEKMFRQSGADIVAADVNEVLDWLAGSG